MGTKTGDIVRLKKDFDEYEKGELFQVIRERRSTMTNQFMYDLIRLKYNTIHNGLYTFRFESYKKNNKDMY